jgi:tRNA (guanine-N7-)-methyltransferase
VSAAGEPRLYGRRKGKRLRPGQARLVAELLPRLAVTMPAPGMALDPRALFGPACREAWLEIGFGGGEHLLAQARARPETGFVGCEPFMNGVAKLLAAIEGEGLANIRIHPDDARPLVAALAPGSLARAAALFPDPWPKSRHHKRRLVGPALLEPLARALRPGAELRLATDDPAYLEAMLDTLAAHPAFEGPEGGGRGLAARPKDWPPTRYEAKALARGAACGYLIYRRAASG